MGTHQPGWASMSEESCLCSAYSDAVQMMTEDLKLEIFPEIFPNIPDCDTRQWPLLSCAAGSRFPRFMHYVLK